MRYIDKSLEKIDNFELSQWAIKTFTNNILKVNNYTTEQKEQLIKLFKDRLLDKVEHDQTS